MLVFVYGTLTDPERVATVLDDWAFAGDADLVGLHRVEGEYPTLAPGGDARGRLLRTDEVERLDAYEGVGSGLYVRVAVPIRGAVGAAGEPVGDSAAVYVGDPGRLGADAAWPGEGPFEARVRRFVDSNEVLVGPPTDRQR